MKKKDLADNYHFQGLRDCIARRNFKNIKCVDFFTNGEISCTIGHREIERNSTFSNNYWLSIFQSDIVSY